MNYAVKVLDREYVVTIDDRGEEVSIELNGRPIDFSYVFGPNKHRFLMLLDSMSYNAEVNRKNGVFSVFIFGREFEVTAEDERLAKLRKVAGIDSDVAEKEIRSPMPGLVVNMLKQVGDKIRKGDGIIVIEAMKMENELKAPADGEIAEILVEKAQSVEKGACLVRFK